MQETASAAAGDDPAAEDVAWAFDTRSPQWQQHGFNREQALAWIDADVANPDEAARLIEETGGTDAAMSWVATVRAGADWIPKGKTAFVINELRKAGVSQKHVDEWLSTTVFERFTVAASLKQPMSVSEAVQLWNDEGFHSDDEIRVWSRGHMTPDQARACRDAMPDGLPDNAQLVWQEACAKRLKKHPFGPKVVSSATRSVRQAYPNVI